MRSRLLIAGPMVVAAVLLAAGCSSARPGRQPAATRTIAAAASAPASPSASAPAGTSCAGTPASQLVIGDFGASALTDVQFVSSTQGWVVGRSEILATTDAGASWTVQDRGDLNLVSADFISSTTGWAVGEHTLLFTDDGGSTWTRLPEPCPALQSVHFVSPATGFAIAGGSGAQGTPTTAPGTGGVVLTTTDGGRSWRQVGAPVNPQSICFSNARSGWLGAGGRLYASADGGRSWTLRAPGEHGQGSSPGFMNVQCANGSAWAEEIGPGAAMNQEPHIGFHAGPADVTPIFAEQYFPHPGVAVSINSPGSYAGPMSAISSSTAAFVDWCGACGYGTVPWNLATSDGHQLLREGTVTGINEASSASFLSSSLGWVVGIAVNGARPIQRIVRTEDGGRSWQVQYSAG
jgi:photosystem II stability/assembly factor-like uncharacterized protein